MKFTKLEHDVLYTPIIQHRKSNLSITSLGAIHIGEPHYYDRLQQELDKIPEGFFEGITVVGEETRIPEDKKPYVDDIKKLSDVYKAVANYLGMVTQKDRLKYPGQWENPDMTLDELMLAAPLRVVKSLARVNTTFYRFREEFEAHPEELSKAIRAGFRFMLRFPRLAEYVALLVNGPGYNKVILNQRNQQLFEAMKQKMYEERTDQLGVIYGAAHLEGIDRFLRYNGFKREGELWIPAWNLDGDLSYFRDIWALSRKAAQTWTDKRKRT